MWVSRIINTFTVVFIISLMIFSSSLKCQNNTIKIAVSMPDFIPIVKAIGGDFVEITGIMPPGSDPHGFSLTKEVIDSITDSSLIVLANSELLHFEEDIKSNYPDKEYTDFKDYVNHGVVLNDFPDFPQCTHGYWLGIDNAVAIARAIAERLGKIDPAHEMIYNSNLNLFITEINRQKEIIEEQSKAYNLYGKKVVATIPGVCYIIQNMGMNVGAVLLAEGHANIDPNQKSKIETNLKNREYIGIVVPESMKNAKPGEIARQISEDIGGTNIIYVRFAMATADDTYPSIIYDNTMRFIAMSKTKVVRQSSLYDIYYMGLIGILALIVAVESTIIYRMHRSHSAESYELYRNINHQDKKGKMEGKVDNGSTNN